MRKNKSFFMWNKLAASIAMSYSVAAMKIIKKSCLVEYVFGDCQCLTRIRSSKNLSVLFTFPIAKYEFASLWIDRKEAAKILRKLRKAK
jgi:hypothetical protein